MREIQEMEALALDLRQVAVLVVVTLGGVFHKFQELAKAFALRDFHVAEPDAEAEGITSGDGPIDDQTFDPDFSVGHPQPDFELDAIAQHGRRFYEAASAAGVREVAPNRSGGAFHAQFDRNKTLHARKLSAIFSPGRGKDVRLERRTGGGISG